MFVCCFSCLCRDPQSGGGMLRFGVSDDQLVYPEPVVGPETGYRVRHCAVSV